MSHIQSTESKNMALQKKAIHIINEKGPINRYKLAVLLGMSPRAYQTFHSFLEEAYDHIVEYVPEQKVWRKIESVSSM